MNEIDKKERLTKSRCQYDLTQGNVSGAIILFIFSVVFVLLFWGIYKTEQDGIITRYFYLLLSGIFAVICVIIVIDIICDYINHKKFRFCIIEDKVIRIYERHRYRTGTHYYIEFGRCTPYMISPINYKWSELSKVFDRELYGMTNIGDEFYIVARRSRDQKGMWVPYMAYNKKFFELSEKSFENRGGIWYVKK